MSYLKNIVTRLESFDILEAVADSIEGNEEAILDYNIEQVKDYGLDGTGQLISAENPYTELTIQLKAEKGTLTANNPLIVNLSDTESYHNKKTIKRNGNKFYIESLDEKNDELVKKYGEGINQLTDDRMRKVGEIIMCDLRDDIRQVLDINR